MRTAWLLALVSGATVASGCGEGKTTAVAAAPHPRVSDSASGGPSATPKPAAAKNDSFLEVSGPLIVEHQVDVTAQRDGIIAMVRTEAGARVKAGALLAGLDDRQITANLEAARAKSRSVENDLKNWQAEAEVIKADYVRAQRLWDEGLIPEEQLQHAKFKAESEQWDIKRVSEMLNTSRHEERSLELELEKTRVVAPFDCLVARRYVREGQTVTRGERLFWVTAEAPLLLRFTLPERFLGHVRAGQELLLTSADVPQEQHKAKITEVSAVIDPSSGTFDVLAQLQGQRGGLRPGMTASVRLDAAQ
jgi:RND family efflux transporter MFP subunit